MNDKPASPHYVKCRADNYRRLMQPASQDHKRSVRAGRRCGSSLVTLGSQRGQGSPTAVVPCMTGAGPPRQQSFGPIGSTLWAIRDRESAGVLLQLGSVIVRGRTPAELREV